MERQIMIRLFTTSSTIFVLILAAMLGVVGDIHGQMRNGSMMRGMPMMQPMVSPLMFSPTPTAAAPGTFTLNPFLSRTNFGVVGSPYSFNQSPSGPLMNPYQTAAMGALYGSGYGYGSYPMLGYGGGGYGGSYGPYSVPAYTRPSSSGYGGPYDRDKNAYPDGDQPAPRPPKPPRSGDSATPDEILSGRALNDILADLARLPVQSQASDPAPVPLNDEGLNHINVSRGAGNMAVLKRAGPIAWPAALTGSEFQERRERFAALARRAVAQLQADGHVDPVTVREVSGIADSLRAQLRGNSPGLSFEAHVEAKKFLNNLDAAVVALQQPDAESYFAGRYSLKARTVPELVHFLAENGLQFAPAMAGDEPAYMALYQALAAYRRAMRAASSAP
jgi:hypothetical protein